MVWEGEGDRSADGCHFAGVGQGLGLLAEDGFGLGVDLGIKAAEQEGFLNAINEVPALVVDQIAVDAVKALGDVLADGHWLVVVVLGRLWARLI